MHSACRSFASLGLLPCPALPCLGLAPHLAPCTAADPGCPVTNLPPPQPPPPTSHIPPQPTAPPTKQLRCNYLGRRSPHRKHRGGWSHAATPPHCPPPWHRVTQPFKKPQSSACAGRWEVTINQKLLCITIPSTKNDNDVRLL